MSPPTNYRPSKGFFSGVLLFLLLLPVLQMNFRFLPEKKVGGTQNKVSKPTLSISQFSKGEFQEQLDTWYSKNLGWRGPLVRSHNQLNLSVFGDLSASIGTPLVLGKNNFLFEQSYINSYNRHNHASPTELRELTSKLQKLQSTLKRKNIEFLLVITPSKAEIYPETIPKKHLHPTRLDRHSAYETILPMLKEQKVNLVDGVDILKTLKADEPYPVFTAGGIHWNYWSACHVSREITGTLSKLLRKNVPAPPCNPLSFKEKPIRTDRDLLAIVNIWDETPFYHKTPYPPETMEFDPKAFHPAVMMVGDSFTWTPLHFFDKHATFRKRKFLYYYSSEFHFWFDPKEVKNKKGKFRKRTSVKRYKGKVELDWKQTFVDRDAVIIFVNQSVIHSAGSGFIEDALAKL